MKIVLVLPAEPGYSETFFPSKIKGLQENGHTVEIHVGSKTGELDFCRVVQSPTANQGILGLVLSMAWQYFLLIPRLGTVVRYIRILRKNGLRFRESIERLYLNAKLLRSKADWIHFGFATQAVGREFVAKAVGASSAVSFRGYDVTNFPLDKPEVYQIIGREVDKIHSISDALYQLGLKYGFNPATPHSIIYPAIDTSRFVPSKFKPIDKGGVIRVLTVGRLHWKKGLLYSVEAVAEVIKAGYKIQYTIVGNGPDYERVAYRAYQLGIADAVTFLGKVNHNELPGLFHKNDIYLQYSVQEGFCNAVLEAQASGLLVVVSDAQGLPENVDHGTSGIVVPKLKPHLLSKAMMNIISEDAPTNFKMRKAAVHRVKSKFSIVGQQRQFQQFYTEDFR